MTIFVLSFAFAQNLYAGEKDGGGGNVIQFKGQSSPFLLDRLMLNPELATQSSEPSQSPMSAREMAQQRLDTWYHATLRSQNYKTHFFIKMLRQALINMPIIEVPYHLKLISRYYLSEEILSLKPKITTAIVYMKGYGAFVSSPIWNNLDVETQAGLLIHESIRQVQFRYGFDDLSDQNLQYLTALIIDTEPETNGDLSPYFSPSLLILSHATGKSYGSGTEAVLGKVVDSKVRELNSYMEVYQNSDIQNIMSQGLILELLKDHIDF